NGITQGMADSTFGSGNTCTRAQIITFLWRVAGSPEMEGSHNFSDVDLDSYYQQPLLWAMELGITTGMSDDSFAPDAPCTRGQIVTFLYRYLV
ncbi:MAG: S-layer homology domain-containing protein, partial [Eubacteriales bacterium]